MPTRLKLKHRLRLRAALLLSSDSRPKDGELAKLAAAAIEQLRSELSGAEARQTNTARERGFELELAERIEEKLQARLFAAEQREGELQARCAALVAEVDRFRDASADLLSFTPQVGAPAGTRPEELSQYGVLLRKALAPQSGEGPLAAALRLGSRAERSEADLRKLCDALGVSDSDLPLHILAGVAADRASRLVAHDEGPEVGGALRLLDRVRRECRERGLLLPRDPPPLSCEEFAEALLEALGAGLAAREALPAAEEALRDKSEYVERLDGELALSIEREIELRRAPPVDLQAEVERLGSVNSEIGGLNAELREELRRTADREADLRRELALRVDEVRALRGALAGEPGRGKRAKIAELQRRIAQLEEERAAEVDHTACREQLAAERSCKEAARAGCERLAQAAHALHAVLGVPDARSAETRALALADVARTSQSALNSAVSALAELELATGRQYGPNWREPLVRLQAALAALDAAPPPEGEPVLVRRALSLSPWASSAEVVAAARVAARQPGQTLGTDPIMGA